MVNQFSWDLCHSKRNQSHPTILSKPSFPRDFLNHQAPSKSTMSLNLFPQLSSLIHLLHNLSLMLHKTRGQFQIKSPSQPLPSKWSMTILHFNSTKPKIRPKKRSDQDRFFQCLKRTKTRATDQPLNHLLSSLHPPRLHHVAPQQNKKLPPTLLRVLRKLFLQLHTVNRML